MFRAASWFAVTLLGVVSVAGPAAAQAKDTIEDVRKAWQARQDGIKAVGMTWTEVRTQPKGALDTPGKDEPGQGPQPPTDLRLPGRGTLTFDDRGLRLEVTRDKWSVTKHRVMSTEETRVHEQDKDVSLTTKSAIADRPSALIAKKRRPGNVMEYTYWPVTCYARGLDARLAPFDLADYELSPRTPVVDGRPCVEFVRNSRTNNAAERVWLDPRRGFVLVQYSMTVDAQTVRRLDVGYANDPTRDWVPSVWDYVAKHPTGDLIESKRVTADVQFLDAPWPAATFGLLLPPGTQVYDEYNGPVVHYVIRADGDPGPKVPDAPIPDLRAVVGSGRERHPPVGVDGGSRCRGGGRGARGRARPPAASASGSEAVGRVNPPTPSRRPTVNKTSFACVLLLMAVSAAFGASAVRVAYGGPVPGPADSPASCTTNCVMTKYHRLCLTNKYQYYDKATCYLCDGKGKSYCDDTGSGNTCKPHQTDTMRRKYIASTEFCFCAKQDGTSYSFVEANKIDAGEVDPDEFPWYRCIQIDVVPTGDTSQPKSN